MTEDEEQGLRRSLTLAADVPPPPDLPQRVLANPRVRRRTALTESPARRWTLIAVAAAAVAVVVIGVTMIGAAARPDRPATVAAPVPTPQPTPEAPASAASVATVAAVAPLLPRGSYQPWSDQTVPCDSAAAVPSAEQQLLNPEATVTGAVVCDTGTRYVPGDGIWTVAGARTLTPTQVDALAKALATTNVPIDPAAMCTANAVLIPDFTLALADGSRVRPGVPGDGCHPAAAVADALAGPPGTLDDQVRQVSSQEMVDSGCAPADRYFDPFNSNGSGEPATRPAAPKGTVSVCRYTVVAGDPTTDPAAGGAALDGLGSTAGSRLGPVLGAQIKPGKTCSAPEAAAAPAVDGWLTVVTPPTALISAEEATGGTVLFTVELGGCHRVLDPNGQPAGFAPGAAVTALADKASTAVVLK